MANASVVNGVQRPDGNGNKAATELGCFGGYRSYNDQRETVGTGASLDEMDQKLFFVNSKYFCAFLLVHLGCRVLWISFPNALQKCFICGLVDVGFFGDICKIMLHH